MKIFLDFDDVLFNTKDFLIFLKEIFREFGVSEQAFQESYEEVKESTGGKNFCYNFEQHVGKIRKLTKINEEALIEALYKGLEEAHKFVFPDVKEFLRYLRDQGYTISILSFGDRIYQALKIEKSGLGALVEKVMVTQESKENILKDQNLESLNTIWFFDDRVSFLENMKKTFPFMKTVLVSRPEGRFEDTKSDLCDYQIFNLEEAKELVKR